MELKLSDCSVQKFIAYALERKKRGMSNNRYNYSYMTENRLKAVFEYMCKRNTKCSGSKYCITDCDGFLGSFSEPSIQSEDLMEEVLFHEVWCKCEWIYRIIDKEREFYDALTGYIGKNMVRKFETAT